MWNEMELEAVSILQRLEEHGFEAFFVGGYVRDKVMGKPVKDIDIATSARPEQVISLFSKTVPTGLKHGTVTVMVRGRPYEVTTYRKESDYEGFRRPTEVEFISDLMEDLRRRDFTMNAMAMDRYGNVRDPFEGRTDMEKGLLRCVGDPHERFYEDALRMLRCVRFASTYGLEVEEATWKALLERRALLRHVAMERVRAELDRMMAGPAPSRGWKLLLQSGLVAETKEPFLPPYADMLEGDIPSELGELEVLESPLDRWMVVGLASGENPDGLRDYLRKLTFSVKDLEAVARVAAFEEWLKLQFAQGEGTPEELWKLAVVANGKGPSTSWLRVNQALQNSNGLERKGLAAIPMDLLLQQGGIWMEEMPVAEVKELHLTGQQLMDRLDKRPGPWMGRLMAEMVREVALGKLDNDTEALLEWARDREEDGAE